MPRFKPYDYDPHVLVAINYACTCCGYATISDPGGYEICPTCFWEDDGQDDPHAEKCFDGPNHVSFLEDRRNLLVFGAAELKARHRGMYGEEVAREA